MDNNEADYAINNETDYKPNNGTSISKIAENSNVENGANISNSNIANVADIFSVAEDISDASGNSKESGKSDESNKSESGSESESLAVLIHQILDEKNQLSISGIARELKGRGFDEHRLVVTGYLRALHDIGDLAEIDIKPSKIYMLKNGSGDLIFDEGNNAGCTTDDIVSKQNDLSGKNEPDFYARLRSRVSGISDKRIRLEVAVYIMRSLFDRPCFETELLAVGCDAESIAKYFEKTDAGTEEFPVRKVRSERNDVRKAQTELSIPKGNAAFEISPNVPRDTLLQADQILFALLKEELNLSGLVLKQTTKNIFDF